MFVLSPDVILRVFLPVVRQFHDLVVYYRPQQLQTADVQLFLAHALFLRRVVVAIQCGDAEKHY